MSDPLYRVLTGDALTMLATLPDASVHCAVTSPPYWGLRDYGTGDAQIGREPDPEAYVAALVAVFAELRRVLRADGTLWLNLGDSFNSAPGPTGRHTGLAEAQRRYDGRTRNPETNSRMNGEAGGRTGLGGRRLNGLKPKDLCGMPWAVAFALRDDGWWLRSDIIWSKGNPMPESIRDRPTRSHEYVFLLSKSARYYYDREAIREEPKPWNAGLCVAPDKNFDASAGYVQRETTYDELKGGNCRSVWNINTEPFPEAHFATYPSALVKRCILAGCPAGGTVLDPFSGSGTTGVVAIESGCRYVGIELNPEYVAMSERRLRQAQPTPLLPATSKPIIRDVETDLFDDAEIDEDADLA